MPTAHVELGCATARIAKEYRGVAEGGKSALRRVVVFSPPQECNAGDSVSVSGSHAQSTQRHVPVRVPDVRRLLPDPLILACAQTASGGDVRFAAYDILLMPNANFPETCSLIVGAGDELITSGRPRQYANWTGILSQRYDMCRRKDVQYVDVAVATAGCEVFVVRGECEGQYDGRRMGADTAIGLAWSVPSQEDRSDGCVPESDFSGGRAACDPLVVVGEGKTSHCRLQTLGL